MSKIEDIVIFEDYAGDDLVVATYSDRGVSLVVPFFYLKHNKPYGSI